jgi:hypothetical protein
MPQLHAVIHTESGRGRGGQKVAAVGTPFTDTGVSTLDRGNLAEILLKVVNIDLASKVTETSNQDKSTCRGEGDGVSRCDWEGVRRNGPMVEDGGLGRHVAIHNTELSGVGRPRNIVDGTLLIQGHTSIKSASSAEQIQRGLAIVTLA